MATNTDPFGFHAAINWDALDALTDAQVDALFNSPLSEAPEFVNQDEVPC